MFSFRRQLLILLILHILHCNKQWHSASYQHTNLSHNATNANKGLCTGQKKSAQNFTHIHELQTVTLQLSSQRMYQSRLALKILQKFITARNFPIFEELLVTAWKPSSIVFLWTHLFTCTIIRITVTKLQYIYHKKQLDELSETLLSLGGWDIKWKKCNTKSPVINGN